MLLCVDLRSSGPFPYDISIAGHSPHHLIRQSGMACIHPGSHREVLTPTRALWTMTVAGQMV